MSDPEFRPDVVAGKYDPQQFDPTGVTLLINEVFYSLQGEGENTGRAAVFIRLAKCNLACKFCDTEFEAFTKRPVEDIANRVRSMVPVIPSSSLGEPGSPAVSPEWMPKLLRELNPLVILTGGEPGLQNCGPLIAVLQSSGFRVCIETGGTVWSPWMSELDHVCVSPKVPLRLVPLPLLMCADEVKWVVNAAFMKMYNEDPDQLWVSGCRNFLQPESLSPKWTLCASKLIMAHPARYSLSLQTHKMAGNP